MSSTNNSRAEIETLRLALVAYVERRCALVVSGCGVHDLISDVRYAINVEQPAMASSALSCLASAVDAGRTHGERAALAWVAEALCYMPNDGTPYEIRNALRAAR